MVYVQNEDNVLLSPITFVLRSISVAYIIYDALSKWRQCPHYLQYI